MSEKLKQRVIKFVSSVMVLLASVAMSGAANAASTYTLVDLTRQANFAMSVNQRSYTGQSFSVSTPSLLAGIGLSLSDFNVDADRSDKYMTFELLSGDGINGSIIGQSTVNVDSVMDDSQYFSVVNFFESSNIFLDSGQYTFRFIGASSRYGFNFTYDEYSGGRGYWFDPLADGGKNNDLRFRVLLTPAATPGVPLPIPSPTWLIALGLITMHAQRRVSRRTTLQLMT